MKVVHLFVIIVQLLIVFLFLYSKLQPYKDKLNDSFKSVFSFCDLIFAPILKFLRKKIKPMNIGTGLALDLSQLLLLILLIILLTCLA